jgi:hypothetical protein
MRRIAQVTDGANKNKFQSEPRTSPGIKASKIVTANELIQVKRTNSQNSERVAVPW